MSKKSKLFERLKTNPKGTTFATIRKLLLQEGFELDRISLEAITSSKAGR